MDLVKKKRQKHIPSSIYAINDKQKGIAVCKKLGSVQDLGHYQNSPATERSNSVFDC